MRRPQVNPCSDAGLNPSAENAAARKHDWMHAICVDNRQFQIAIKWRSRYRMPHESPHQNLGERYVGSSALQQPFLEINVY
jgi:hypothetical protein